jgi:hypothetical protein
MPEIPSSRISGILFLTLQSIHLKGPAVWNIYSGSNIRKKIP